MNLNPGTYYGKLVDAGLGAVGKNDTPAFILTFEITHIAAAAGWDGINPVRRDVQFYLTDGARDFSFADLRALGFNGDWDAPALGADLTEGTELVMHLDEYQGKQGEKWKVAKLMRGRERKPVNADIKRTLAAQFRAAAAATAKPSTPPPAPRPAGGAPAAAGASATARPAQRPAAVSGNDEPPF